MLLMPYRTGLSGIWRGIATRGTAQAIRRMGIPVHTINKIGEGSPHVVDWIERGGVDLVINTPFGRGPRTDGYFIRTAAAAAGVPCITTVPGIVAAVQGIEALRDPPAVPVPIQEYHAAVPPAGGPEQLSLVGVGEPSLVGAEPSEGR